MTDITSHSDSKAAGYNESAINPRLSDLWIPLAFVCLSVVSYFVTDKFWITIPVMGILISNVEYFFADKRNKLSVKYGAGWLGWGKANLASIIYFGIVGLLIWAVFFFIFPWDSFSEGWNQSKIISAIFLLLTPLGAALFSAFPTAYIIKALHIQNTHTPK